MDCRSRRMVLPGGARLAVLLSRASLALWVAQVAPAHALGFVPVTSPLSDLDPSAASFGDYDGDGDLDLVIVGRRPPDYEPLVELLRNDDGTFELLDQDLPRILDGPVAWGDFDGDGDLDLGLCGHFEDSPNQFRVAICRNDGGQFEVTHVRTLPRGMVSTASWDDYDRDGDLDFFIGGQAFGGISVLVNDEGSFGELRVRGPVGDTWVAEWGDFDNDGDRDLMFAGERGRTASVDVFRNDAGTFVPLGRTQDLGSSAAWGDFDQDGDLDLAFPYRLLRNDGDEFVRIDLDVEYAHGDLDLVDVDADGDLDFVIALGPGGTRAPLLMLNCEGDFKPAAVSIPLRRAHFLEWGDFDGDGDLDLLGDGYQPGLLENVADQDNHRPTAPGDLESVCRDGTVSLSWGPALDGETRAPALTYNVRVGTTPGGNEVVPAMATSSGTRLVSRRGNAEHRRSLDLVDLSPGTYYWSVQALDAAFVGGAFAPEMRFEIGPEDWLTKLEFNVVPVATGQGHASWADFDGDGDLDLYLSGQGPKRPVTVVYRNDSHWLVSMPAAELTGLTNSAGIWGVSGFGWPAYLAFGRAAGLVPASRIVHGSDFWGLTQAESGLPDVAEPAVAWADFDNDGRREVLLAGMGADGPIVGRFTRSPDHHRKWISLPVSIDPVVGGAIDWADVDSDGDFDVLLAAADPGTRLYLNQGGTFVPAGLGLPPLDNASVRFGDDDADGDLDILLAGELDAATIVQVWRNSSGRFTPFAIDVHGIEATDVEWGDLDGDGDLDLVVGSRTAKARSAIFRNENGTYRQLDWDVPLADDVDIEFGDEDGDGDLDFHFSGMTAEGPISLIFRNNLGSVAPAPTPPVDLCTETESLADGRVRVRFRWAPPIRPGEDRSLMTYNLRIGTEPGEEDILASFSNLDTGFRRVPRPGNAGSGNSWSIRLEAPGIYHWSVQAVDAAWRGSAFADEQVLDLPPVTASPAAATATHLHPASPNPFNPRTRIRFELAAPGRVSLCIYDLAGRRVRSLLDETQSAGPHELVWEGRDDTGRAVASGVYLCRMVASGIEETQRVTLLR